MQGNGSSIPSKLSVRLVKRGNSAATKPLFTVNESEHPNLYQLVDESVIGALLAPGARKGEVWQTSEKGEFLRGNELTLDFEKALEHECGGK